MTLPSSKPCALCGVEKPLEDFTPHKRGKFGRFSYCRPCNAAYVRGQNQDPKVRAQAAERTRRRRMDPDKREADRLASLAWKKRNPGKVRAQNLKPEVIAYQKDWNRRNADKRLGYVRAYQARNPEIGKVSQQRRRARKLDTESRLTQAEWLEILHDFNHACAYCLRRDLPLQQEHMTPLATGGRHDRANVVPACGPCNYRKHTRNLLQFLAIGA